jgi:hypothetical protein
LSAGTSTVILSVSSSTSVSPIATASPSFLFQREMVASVMLSPSGGTLMGIIAAGSSGVDQSRVRVTGRPRI